MSPDAPPPLRSLSPEQQRLVDAVLSLYREGWFPMHDEDTGEVQWVQPRNRGILPLEPHAFRTSRSLRAAVRNRGFVLTTDRAFADVIRRCAAPARGREQTWLSDEIIELFELLHAAGHAHSLEVWLHDSATTAPRLVGGLYGLALGGVFCGESMFSSPESGGTDASKVALVHLVHHLRSRGFSLLDAQLTNEHLAQFGCHEISQPRYLRLLGELRDHPVPWLPFQPETHPLLAPGPGA
ncbi:MAG: leucyl/phenylalanyl-tRNA--protein transferase [Leptolyngbya sp. PLA1]|nr:leucyl/phenylalanyl-tRNA--protein transferase [Leptolyngbya sp. PLA1]